MLVVYARADAGIGRDEVHAEDVEGLLVFVEIVVAEHPVEEEFLDLVVEERLVRGCEPIAEHGDVDLGPGRTGAENLGHGVSH